eukprot:15178445-Alexandrium_andersonii.AAC.1
MLGRLVAARRCSTTARSPVYVGGGTEDAESKLAAYLSGSLGGQVLSGAASGCWLGAGGSGGAVGGGQ